MMHLALHALALVRFGGDKVISGGVFPLLLIATVVGLAAWALARRDRANNERISPSGVYRSQPTQAPISPRHQRR